MRRCNVESAAERELDPDLVEGAKDTADSPLLAFAAMTPASTNTRTVEGAWSASQPRIPDAAIGTALRDCGLTVDKPAAAILNTHIGCQQLGATWLDT